MARKILLADDSVTAQNMGRKILADAGYEVITVNNGSAALKKIAEQKPDLILLDVYMPGYSGLEVCQRVKEAQETSRIPVLLTVGKLEPFKPEEAGRVRAEGFIVKPFEASELLSAISKLEDKIVPRAETSKSGRFARSITPVEETRYDKGVAGPVDEDSGWKNRIAFPSKKKGKPEEEDGDDPAIYNAINKDLRTVVDHKPQVSEPPKYESKATEFKPEEVRVDLAALAPHGLPKDVTPEEIAALAAAAAQVKGKITEFSEPKIPATVPEPVAAQTETVQEQAKTADKIEAQEVKPHEESTPVSEPVKDSPALATFAEQKSEDKIEASTDTLKAESSSVIAPSHADMVAAIASPEPANGTSWGTNAANGSGSHGDLDIPVTMAVAAAVGAGGGPSRWTAVSVAVAVEDSSGSLEQEMQKAYAAFAAAEIGPAGSTASIPANDGGSTAAENGPPMATAAEPVTPATPAPAPEVAQSWNAVENVPTESTGVKEMEVVAAQYDAQSPVQPEAAASPAEQPVEAQSAPQAAAEEVRTHAADESPSAESKPAESEPAQHDLTPTEPETHGEKQETKEEPAPVVAAAPVIVEEAVRTNTESEVAAQASANESSANLAEAPAASNEPAAGGMDPMAKKESEIAATTAAAWASWHHIRETGDPAAKAPESTKASKNDEDDEDESHSPRDQAAMAVAAGAEKTPEDSTEDDPALIASIVDSVLADMRPKIVEEITRKMKKKK